MSNDLVSTAWLARHLGSSDLVILDASWHMPAAKRDPQHEFIASRIPGARFFDIDDISDSDSPLPHMLPSPEKFASRMRKLGVGDGHRIVIYDSVGLFSAARAWWTFKVFGHDDVAVLDGGLPKWKSENRALESGPVTPPVERHFSAKFRPSMVRDKHDVARLLAGGQVQFADARSPGRFRGEEAEPRAHVRSGHMPGARNVPFAQMLTSAGTLKQPAEIRAAFAAAGIDPDKPVITSCGSGVTAAVLTLGLTVAGSGDHALYDGSWTDWGGDPESAVVTGP